MKSQQTAPKPESSPWWRKTIVVVLTVLGLVLLVGFSIVHWTERQLLTTDNWVKIVSPLPKNDAVATALSNYSVATLFSGINVQQKISDVLPPKADFLAPTLATQLKSSVTKGAKQIVQSDRFQNLWIAANKAAHQRLMATARQDTPPAPAKTTNISLNLTSLKTSIGSVLGKNSGSLLGSGSSPSASSGVSLGVKIKTAVGTFRKYVQTVDFLNGVLGLLAVVLLVGAIVASKARARLVIIIGVAIFVIGLLQLIAVKAFRPDILNQIHDAAFRPAVGVVYDALVSTFHKTAMVAVVAGLLIAAVAYLASAAWLRRSEPVSKTAKSLERRGVPARLRVWRLFTGRYRWYMIGGVAMVVLVLLAFVLNPTGLRLLRALLLVVLIAEAISLFALKPPVSARRAG